MVDSEGLVEYRTDLVKQLQTHKQYQQYMFKVLEVAGDFHEISEIMSRYQTLIATHEVAYSLCARAVIFMFLVLVLINERMGPHVGSFTYTLTYIFLRGKGRGRWKGWVSSSSSSFVFVWGKSKHSFSFIAQSTFIRHYKWLKAKAKVTIFCPLAVIEVKNNRRGPHSWVQTWAATARKPFLEHWLDCEDQQRW